MPAVDLVFAFEPLDLPADLVFGEELSPPNRDVELEATFDLSFRARVGPRIEVYLDAEFALTVDAEVDYDVAVNRPLVGQVDTRHQTAQALQLGRRINYQDADPVHAGFEPRHQIADALQLGIEFDFEHGDHLDSTIMARHQDAMRLPTWQIESRHQEGIRDLRLSTISRFDNAAPLRNQIFTDFQERYHDRRPQLEGRWQEGDGLAKSLSAFARTGLPYLIRLESSFQDAMVPPPGVSLPPEPPDPPTPEPCYEPDPDLVFRQVVVSNGDLLFICNYGDGAPPAQVVVPIRRVYVVINTVSLLRVENDLEIPVLSMSLSIDADSWTWGFSASLPADELFNVLPDSNGPIELEATINGTSYRVLAERVSRERAFNSATIRIRGRGKSATLASPYSAQRVFTNSIQRTAQQLMADVLTFNEVPIGWDIDWQIDDWLVPAGAFSMNGSYIDGLTAIVGAAGAYLQPHPVNQELSVLHRYPTAPWDWAGVTPDFELPSAVTLQEGIEWDEKPTYNRVYVSGTSYGILARVTRTGTAGDLVAPLITDPLITETAAGRQRGLSILGDTGRQARVALRLPVLDETGIITPGKFVRYVDGGDDRIGIVRAVSVDVGYPEVWQSLTVETHTS